MAKILPDESFEVAPLCRRIVMILVVTLVILACLDSYVVLRIVHAPGAGKALTMIVPLTIFVLLVGPSIVAGIWLCARIKAYELTGGELIVRRALSSPRFRLEGLVSVEEIREPLKGARKVFGNDGLGAISGRFESAATGKFMVYLSDPDNAIALRWSDGTCVILSPAHPEVFRRALRARAS